MFSRNNYDVQPLEVRSGDIYMVSLNEKGGSLPSTGLLGKTRPCLILSDQVIASKYSLFSEEPNVFILPFTLGELGFKEIEIRTPTGVSYPRFDCMQDIRISRLKQFMYRLSDHKMALINIEIDKLRGYNVKDVDKQLTKAIDTIVELKNTISSLMLENEHLKAELQNYEGLKSQINSKPLTSTNGTIEKAIAVKTKRKKAVPYELKTEGLHKGDVIKWSDSKIREFLEMSSIANSNKEIMNTYNIQSAITLYHISNYCKTRIAKNNESIS